MRTARVLVVTVFLAAGCGGESGTAVGTKSRSTQPALTRTVGTEHQMLELYLIDPTDRKLYAVRREIDPTPAVGAAALELLAKDPDSEVPPNLSLAIDKGDAKVRGSQLSPAALAQVVYTLTQFPTVSSVNGNSRKDVEDFVPPILVEQPTSDEIVTSPLHVTGNANTFEATFEYDLVDDTGKVLAHHFETATSGSGERGTFDFTVSFRVDKETNGALLVYESSAENGQRIHERTIPLTLRP